MEETSRPKRGFAAGTNAADAARKNHALGTAHKWTTAQAREHGRRGAEQRWAKARDQGGSKLDLK